MQKRWEDQSQTRTHNLTEQRAKTGSQKTPVGRSTPASVLHPHPPTQQSRAAPNRRDKSRKESHTQKNNTHTKKECTAILKEQYQRKRGTHLESAPNNPIAGTAAQHRPPAHQGTTERVQNNQTTRRGIHSNSLALTRCPHYNNLSLQEGTTGGATRV